MPAAAFQAAKPAGKPAAARIGRPTNWTFHLWRWPGGPRRPPAADYLFGYCTQTVAPL